VPRPRKIRLKRANGTNLLVVFLVVTLGLSLWLGYQALDAAGSHRRTAEGVLTDYAGIAALEYSRRIEEGLGRFNRSLFDDIPRTLGRRVPDPEVMENDLYHALRGQDCRCEALRDEARYFRVDLRNHDVATGSDTLPSMIRDRLGSEVLRHREAHPELRTALLTLRQGALSDLPSVIIYMVSRLPDGGDAYAYGMVAGSPAFGELFSAWYAREPLLPASLSSSQPNDSLLQVSLLGPDDLGIFQSPSPFPDVATVQDTLDSEFGSMVVQAGIRQDAASHLIIGGLPRSRLPLLFGLMLLTLGVGGAALLQLRREYQLARLQDDFISGVSHEFRTPLTQIRVFAELLDDEKLRTEEERKRSTRVINREARRLTHLVENILQFSRVSRVPMALGELEEIDLETAVEELAEAFGPQAEARQARIEKAVPPGLTVYAARGGIYRILANLLDNALKYGPSGQTVELQAAQVGDAIRISVGDEGPGIPPRDRKRVWDPYRRLDRDVSGEVQGSGIGLAVVSQLCSAYSGQAWVEAGERGGARFVVELPSIRVDGQHPPPNPQDQE
jgi:signal transduction histidine kinase